MNSSAPKLAIISPACNEELLVASTAEALLRVLDDLMAKAKIQPDSFVCFVDDGSTDATWQYLEAAHRQHGTRIRAFKLSRNFGHQAAILAGLLEARARADCFVTIDADLQDDAAVIEKFIDAYQAGFQIAYGVKRNTRSDSLYKKIFTIIFHNFTKLMGIQTVYNHADFRFASRAVVEALSSFSEVNLFLRGLFPLIGFKSTTIAYSIRPRSQGESKYSLKKLITLAGDGITSFSVTPLHVLVIGAALLFLLALLLLVLMLGGFIHISDLLWALIIMLVLGSLQFLGLGVLGTYIGKIYKETKARPRYIIEKEL